MKIADKWNEVSLKQYIEIVDVIAIDMDEIDKQVKIVSILSNTPEEKVLQLDLPNLKSAIRVCQFIYTKPEPKGIKQYLRVNGKKFDINTDLRKLSAGEYIDFTSFIKDKSEVTKNLPKILSIFLHPVNWLGFRIKSNYENGIQTLESRNNTAKFIEDKIMMDDVMNLSGFFLKNWEALTKATQDYSAMQILKAKMKLKKVIKKDLQSFGVGT